MGVEVYLHSFVTSPLNGGERSASSSGRFTPGETAAGTLGGHHSRSRNCGELTKRSFALAGNEQ